MFLSVRFLKISFSVLFFFILASPVFSAEIHVPGAYATIQEGVNASVDGDTVIVGDGIYTENIWVNKSLTIRSENGALNTSVQAMNAGSHVFSIAADQVTIEGFTITGASGAGYCGIAVNSGYGQCTFRDNRVGTGSSPNYYGIYLSMSHDNNLENNIISNNTNYGILIAYGTGNTVINNSCFSNGIYGICCLGAGENRFIENELRQNTSYGIILANGSNNNFVSQNILSDNAGSMRIAWESNNNEIVGNICQNSTGSSILVDHDSINNKISKNEITNNFIAGIQLWDTGANELFENNISGNSDGIGLQNVTDCRVYGNSCNGNGDNGIVLSAASQRNQIYNNECTGNDKTGISIYDSPLNIVYANTCNDNVRSGISLFSSSDNIFFRNNATGNLYGAWVQNSLGNRIFLNSFTENGSSIFSLGSETLWQSEQEETYLFNGISYTGFLGNFYSDHLLADSNGDGVTDLPKDQPDIDLDDDYPLAGNHASFITTTGDMDFDEDVDGLDAALFIYALASGRTAADLNQDAVLNSADIGVFAAVFGR